MRKLYIDNIRWITVVLVVLYHVIYMFNGIETFGVIGPFSDVQYQDAFQYIVYHDLDFYRFLNENDFSISYTHGLCCCCLRYPE